MPAKRRSATSRPIAEALLGWYDRHARTLPWRAPPGAPPPDPYRVWLSEVMLQQTTVAAVAPRYAAFLDRWPTIAALAAAPEADVLAQWAGLGYYARARNLIACARAVVRDHGGAFPGDEARLRDLPGLGDYTAAAVAAIAFGRRAVAVDANVARVVARLFALETPLPAGRAAIRAAADTIVPDKRAGDFTQAMMDLGSSLCTPRAPKCLLCPLQPDCAGFASGHPEDYPAPKAKRAQPQRYGTAFWLEHDGKVLLVRRPDKGLLGGMRALPTGPWTDTPPGLQGAPGALADWRMLNRHIGHVFTHFRLELALAKAYGRAEMDGEWWPIAELGAAGLPTVFARAAEPMEDMR